MQSGTAVLPPDVDGDDSSRKQSWQIKMGWKDATAPVTAKVQYSIPAPGAELLECERSSPSSFSGGDRSSSSEMVPACFIDSSRSIVIAGFDKSGGYVQRCKFINDKHFHCEDKSKKREKETIQIKSKDPKE